MHLKYYEVSSLLHSSETSMLNKVIGLLSEINQKHKQKIMFTTLIALIRSSLVWAWLNETHILNSHIHYDKIKSFQITRISIFKVSTYINLVNLTL